MGDVVQGTSFHLEYARGLTDVAHLQEYQTSQSKSSSPGLEVKIVDPGTERAATLRQTDASLGRVIENRLLTKPGGPMKRHIGQCKQQIYFTEKCEPPE